MEEGEDGWTSVVFADSRANPLNPMEGHKTLNYWWRLRELQVAAGKGAGGVGERGVCVWHPLTSGR